MYEVEIKFRVADIHELQRHLDEFGCQKLGCAVEEIDTFLQHPCKDFVQSDECLRLRKRVCPSGTIERTLTYKGPKLDKETKTRQEIEIPVDDPQAVTGLFTALGFQKSASVRKYRQRTELQVDGLSVEVTLDTLPDLPRESRTFAEIETLAPTEKELDKCRALILNIAQQLGLTDSVRESYLALVTKRQEPM